MVVCQIPVEPTVSELSAVCVTVLFPLWAVERPTCAHVSSWRPTLRGRPSAPSDSRRLLPSPRPSQLRVQLSLPMILLEHRLCLCIITSELYFPPCGTFNKVKVGFRCLTLFWPLTCIFFWPSWRIPFNPLVIGQTLLGNECTWSAKNNSGYSLLSHGFMVHGLSHGWPWNLLEMQRLID